MGSSAETARSISNPETRFTPVINEDSAKRVIQGELIFNSDMSFLENEIFIIKMKKNLLVIDMV